MVGDAEKKLRQNEWQVNCDVFFRMMRIMHGAGENERVKKILKDIGFFSKETQTPLQSTGSRYINEFAPLFTY